MVGILLVLSIFSQSADTLRDSLNVDVWFNKDEPIYYPGEKLKVFFKANKDCYIAVYDIEVGGRETLLFPQPGDKGLVHANQVYELPPEDADFDYEITGPEGTERIVVLASQKSLPKLEELGGGVIKEEIEINIEEPEPAKLRIISTPRRCRIYIEDVNTGEEVYIGVTPRTIVLKPGEYVVRIKKTGYLTLQRRIRLDPDEKRRIYARLLPW
ncbi:MAG: DUF4384 domain-containing protein [candidate division WOR-3 bacterium]